MEMNTVHATSLFAEEDNSSIKNLTSIADYDSFWDDSKAYNAVQLQYFLQKLTYQKSKKPFALIADDENYWDNS